MATASTLDKIVSVKERLQLNLSSHQTISILDKLLQTALQPIFFATQCYKDWSVELLNYLFLDGKRKISTLEFQEQADILFSMILAKAPEQRFLHFQALRLNRGVSFHFAFKLTELARPYHRSLAAYVNHNLLPKKQQITPQAMDRLQTLQEELTKVEQLLGGNRTVLDPALQAVSWFIEQASTYRSMIAEKYYRLAYRDAMRAWTATQVTADMDDLYSNYLMAVGRAIDRFDSHKGTLTDYLLRWLKNASVNSLFDHQYRQAYTMPSTRRRQLQKTDWINRSGQLEQNLAQDLDENAANSLVVQTEDKRDADHLLGNLVHFAKDWDIKMALVASGLDFPLSRPQ